LFFRKPEHRVEIFSFCTKVKTRSLFEPVRGVFRAGLLSSKKMKQQKRHRGTTGDTGNGA